MPDSTPHIAAAHDHVIAAERALDALPARHAARGRVDQAAVAQAHATIAVAILMLAERVTDQ